MRWDGTSGKYDMGFRTYDPGLNQFASRDMFDGALGDAGLSADPFTGSRYAFGSGNPISNIESDGHSSCPPPLISCSSNPSNFFTLPSGSGGGGTGSSTPSPSIPCGLLCTGATGGSGIAGMTPGVSPCPIVDMLCASYLNLIGGSSQATTPGQRGPGGIAVPLPGEIPEGLLKIGAGAFTLAALAAAVDAASKFFKERRSSSCLSGGPEWEDNGPLDTEGNTLHPGRATTGMACITSESTDPGGVPRALPGYDPATMNLAHLVPREFGGVADPDNIVLLWEKANTGWDMDPSTGFTQMRRVENQIERTVSPTTNVLYYAQAIYSPLQGTEPGGTPYMPIGIYIRWQAQGGPAQQAFVQNAP